MFFKQVDRLIFVILHHMMHPPQPASRADIFYTLTLLDPINFRSPLPIRFSELPELHARSAKKSLCDQKSALRRDKISFPPPNLNQ